jgi:hypothetical protein
MSTVAEDALGGFRRITLANSLVRAQFLPGLGGKMTSLVRIATAHEFLLQPQRPLRYMSYGDRFADYDTSGFDECIPTVSTCRHPQTGQRLPDHGELWSVPWEIRIVRGRLRLAAEGRALPYRLEKAVYLEGADVVIDYTFVNRGDVDLEFLWSAHPLLTVEPGSRIVLPNDVNELLVNYSSQDRLGSFGSTCTWPVVRSARSAERIDVLRPPGVGLADKLFTSRLNQGYCGLYKPASKEFISFRFDPATVPFIGLWICQGGWPDPAHGHYTVALEPCTGRPDSLEIAIARGENDYVQARAEKSWTVRLSLGSAPPNSF